MEILRDYSQIVEKVKNIFSVDVSNFAILDNQTTESIKNLIKDSKINKDKQEVSKLAELIFQLNNYIPPLCNFVKMFLFTRFYEGIICFMEKLFVAHVGSNIYNSKNGTYSHRERFFDRFIEVVKSTNLEVEDYIDFLFAIVEDNSKTDLSVWLAPTLEYLTTLFRESGDVISEFVKNNPEHTITYYNLGLEFNTQKTIGEIFNLESVIDEKLIAKILKHYYTDTMSFFDKNLDQAGDKKMHYVKILASIENPEVTARLEDLYENETNEEIKAFIKSKLGIADKTNLGCAPQHFAVIAHKKISDPQERTLGIPFDKITLRFIDGEDTDNVVKTYLINIFKEEKDLLNLYGLSDVNNLFDNNDLYDFASKLFESVSKFNDIKEAKWAIRLISLLAKDYLEEQIYDFIYDLFTTNRIKEAKYFTECLIYSKKERVVNLLLKVYESKNQKFLENLDYYVNLYAENLNKSLSDVHDLLINDEPTAEMLQTQKQRLFNNFIANKSYTKAQFEEMFIGKKVFNKLAQNLVFGEYKQNRICSAFVIDGDQIKYLVKAPQENEQELQIKIVHGIDLDDRFENVVNYFNDYTFEQFPKNLFVVKDQDKNNAKVSSMHGVLINSIKFITNITANGFIKNISQESEPINEVVHISPELNLLAEVSFESPVTSLSSTTSLGSIRFYKLNQCLKNGSTYIINKANAITVGSVGARYYNFVVGSVSKALKN